MTTQPHARAIFNDGSSDREVAIDSWSISRSLSSWGLPGQAKIPTGVGTGSGSLSALDTFASTWTLSQHITPGCRVRVQGTHNSPSVGEVRLLSGVVRDVNADGDDPLTRSVGIEDDMGALQRTPRVPVALATGPTGAVIDAAYLLDQCARTAGYFSTPPPSALCRLSVPLAGSIAAERGSQADGHTGAVAWTSFEGQVVPANLPVTAYALSVAIPVTNPIIVRARGRANSTAAFAVRAHNAAGTSYVTIAFRHSGLAWQWQRQGSGTWATAGVGDSARAEWEITWTSNTVVSVRGRRLNEDGTTGTWSTAATQTGTSLAAANYTTVTLAGEISAVQVYRAATPPPVWSKPTAQIAATGIGMQAIIVPPKRSCWEIAQDVARASSGALWIDEDGRLTFMPLVTFLARPATYPLQVQNDLAERPWGLSRDDYADRLEVTYTPPSIATVANFSLPVWESTEVTMIPANSTVAISEQLNVAAEGLGVFSTGNWATIPATGSYWCAANAAKNGTQVTSNVSISASLPTPHRITVSIVNNNAFPVWLVDYDGNPVLIARANKTASSGEQATVELGASNEDALVPASLDLGTIVQDETAATAIGTDLWNRLQSPAIFIRGVETWPIASMRLGDVVTITDGPGGLATTKCVITGITNSGSDGSWIQTVDLGVVE